MTCAARSQQAAELSENVHQDCILPLKKLLEGQDTQYNAIVGKARAKQDKLHAIDSEIKKTAMAYFKAARDAEDSVVKY